MPDLEVVKHDLERLEKRVDELKADVRACLPKGRCDEIKAQCYRRMDTYVTEDQLKTIELRIEVAEDKIKPFYKLMWGLILAAVASWFPQLAKLAALLQGTQ